MDQPAMLFYILQKNPVFFSTSIDPGTANDAGSVDFVMTDGMALYVSQTFPCIAQLSNQIGEDVSWITGHSLGGAAATFYKMVVDTPDSEIKPTLVTFGALPTALISTDGASQINWPCSNAQFELNGCAVENPTGF